MYDDSTTQTVRQYTALGIEVMTSLKVPLTEMIRALSAAQVDAYIDARSHFMVAGWSNELADAVVLGMVQRNIEFSKAVSEAIQKAQANRSSSK